jgi:hypothetical protein
MTYPFIQGGNGGTKWLAMDIDTSGNFIIGGTTTSTDLVSGTNTPNPILMFI